MFYQFIQVYQSLSTRRLRFHFKSLIKYLLNYYVRKWERTFALKIQLQRSVMNYKIDYLKCVKCDWHHKWCSLHNYKLYDYVKGPLKFPMVTVPLPYLIREKDDIDQCDCTKHIKECYSKPGIPDPWSEYLIFGREAAKGKDLSRDFPKIDLDITNYLDKNYRVYIGQGIPDPWKNLTHIEPSESNMDNLRKNWKSYLDNLRIGPGCDMYDVDKVCCPNCNRRLLVLCLKKRNQDDKEVEKEVAHNDSDSKPMEEKLVEQKIYLKDACVETDYKPDTKNVEVQLLKTCDCKLNKPCICNDDCSSCPVCNQLKNETKTERCECKKNSIKSGYFYNSGPNCPMRNKNSQQCSLSTDQSDTPPLLKIENGHLGSIIPFFCSNCDNCGCSGKQFIGFQDKNNHGLELQLICPKCEKKRKKRRKTECNTSSEPRRENQFPCHCTNNGRGSFQRYTSEYHICNCTSKAHDIKKRIKPKTSFNGAHRCQCHCKEQSKTSIFQDKDYLHLLNILGYNGFVLNDLNTDWDEPKTTRNKVSSKSKRQPFPRPNHSYWEGNLPEINRKGFHDLERGWTDRDYKHEINRRSTGMKNEFETVRKDSEYTSKRQIPRRLLYNSYCTSDELRKMRSHLRRQKNRSAFKKELNYFLSNCSKNGLSYDSESSSQTRKGGRRPNMESKPGRSSWQKDGNVTEGG